MAGGGSQQSGTTHQISEVKLPPWVEKASQENYGRAQDVANRPYEAYPGQIVADWNPTLQAAQGMLPTVGSFAPWYQGAANELSSLMSFNPTQIQAGRVNAGQLKDTDLAPYMNPYTENVINRTTANMERSGLAAQNKIAADAAAGKSFGGSRQAIQQGVQQAETTRGIGDYAGKARADAYAAATANATADLNRALTGDTTNLQNWTDVQKANVSAQLSAAGLQKDAANSLVAAATAGQESAIRTLGQYMQMGGALQQQQQRELDAKRGQWQEARDYPLEQLNILLSSLGMSPYGKTETSSKTSDQKTSKSPDIIGGITGTLGALAPLLAFASDRSLKTDITKLGDDEELGLPMYAYRYKGDPKSYPKTVGPMAQDVEKKYPQLVRKVAGKRAIDLTHLAA